MNEITLQQALAAGVVTEYHGGFRFVETEPLPTAPLTIEMLERAHEILNRNEVYTEERLFYPYQQELVQRMFGERDLARGGRDEGTGAVWRAKPEGLVRVSCSTGDPGLNRKQRRALARARLTASRLPANHGPKMVPGRSDQLGEKRPMVLWTEKADPLRFAP